MAQSPHPFSYVIYKGLTVPRVLPLGLSGPHQASLCSGFAKAFPKPDLNSTPPRCWCPPEGYFQAPELKLLRNSSTYPGILCLDTGDLKGASIGPQEC